MPEAVAEREPRRRQEDGAVRRLAPGADPAIRATPSEQRAGGCGAHHEQRAHWSVEDEASNCESFFRASHAVEVKPPSRSEDGSLHLVEATGRSRLDGRCPLKCRILGLMLGSARIRLILEPYDVEGHPSCIAADAPDQVGGSSGDQPVFAVGPVTTIGAGVQYRFCTSCVPYSSTDRNRDR